MGFINGITEVSVFCHICGINIFCVLIIFQVYLFAQSWLESTSPKPKMWAISCQSLGLLFVLAWWKCWSLNGIICVISASMCLWSRLTLNSFMLSAVLQPVLAQKAAIHQSSLVSLEQLVFPAVAEIIKKSRFKNRFQKFNSMNFVGSNMLWELMGKLGCSGIYPPPLPFWP